jgi:hypothetical protein
MEEILASIRRIIADDEPAAEAKAAPAAAVKPAAAPKPAPVPEPAAEPEGELNQDDIDAMLASFDSPPVPGKEPPAAKKEDDVLELTKPIAKAAPAEAVPAEIDFRDAIAGAQADADEDMAGWGLEAEPEPEPESVAMAPRSPTVVARSVEEALLAPEAGSAVASAFSSLAHTILGQNARTLDDLVEDMLRPMLKAWLDDNLPTIVERLVRAEIERVSRGPRR